MLPTVALRCFVRFRYGSDHGLCDGDRADDDTNDDDEDGDGLMADTVRILMIRTAVILVAVSVTHAPRTLIADSARVC